MGRGDKKTRRGKISAGTFGVSRPARQKKSVAAAPPAAEAGEAPTKAPRKVARKKAEE